MRRTCRRAFKRMWLTWFLMLLLYFFFFSLLLLFLGMPKRAVFAFMPISMSNCVYEPTEYSPRILIACGTCRKRIQCNLFFGTMDICLFPLNPFYTAEGPRLDPFRLFFFFKNCGLRTLSCDFARIMNETLKCRTQPPA